MMVCLFIVAGCSSETNFTPPAGHKGPAITHYSFGKMIVDGQSFTNELQILPDGTVKEWSPRDPHYILAKDIEEIVRSDIKVLIIGIGANGEAAIPAATLEILESNNIKVHIANTYEAVKLFNVSAKEALGAIFHLNC